MWLWLCLMKWSPVTITGCLGRSERAVSAKTLPGTEMVQNEKRSLDPQFSTFRSRLRKLLTCKYMLPVMKKGRMNQRVKPRAKRVEPKASEGGAKSLRGWSQKLQRVEPKASEGGSKQTLEPNQGTSHFAWLHLRTAMDWELLCDSHFPPFLNWNVHGSFPVPVPPLHVGCMESADLSL